MAAGGQAPARPSAGPEPERKRSKWDLGADGRTVTAAPLQPHQIRICRDYYPDPEPDTPAVLHPAAVASAASLVPSQVQQRVRVNRQGEVVDQFGQAVALDADSVKALSLNRRRQQQQQQQSGAGASAAEGPPAQADQLAVRAREPLEAPPPDQEGGGFLLPKAELAPDSRFYDRSMRRPRGGQGRRSVQKDLELVEPGKYVEHARKMRCIIDARKTFRDRKRQADLAAKRGEEIVVDPQLAAAVEREDANADSDLLEVPDCEWWDAILLSNRSYDDIGDLDAGPESWGVRMDRITPYIEHPVQREGPNMPLKLPPEPLRLTAKERKRIRTRNRIAREKEKQEQMRRGLIPKPVPRVRISNIYAVKGREAVQDPTVVERFVREEAAARVRRHDERNHARRLLPEERREKNIARAKADAADNPVVSVYRIRNLEHGQAKWKIQEEAKNRYLCGLLILTPSMNMIIVEGGAKPQRHFAGLVLRRIDYRAELPDGVVNAERVWQGFTDTGAFSDFRTNTFSSAAKARKYLSEIDCAHYWDMVMREEQGERELDLV